MATITPPGNAQSMHRALDGIGLVDRVKSVLMNKHNGVLELRDVLCWVIRDRGELKIRVMYQRRITKSLSKHRGAFEDADGTFIVSTTMPFGPVGADSLSAADVAAVGRIAQQHGV